MEELRELRQIAGLGELEADYDGFILDLWGVLHNGVRAYDEAVSCARRLRSDGKSVWLLSNAPRVSARVRRHLDDLGVARDAYDGIVTSGDLTRRALAARDDPWHARLGRRYFFLGRDDDGDMLAGLDFERVDDLPAADFVLCLGFRDATRETVDDYRDLMRAARRLDLPLVCGNPDLVVMRGAQAQPCAGALAEAYAAMGGDVAWHGKPHAPAYRACIAGMGGTRAVLAVGDSLRTDIAGANDAGLDGLFVAGGIHADSFGVRAGEPLDLAPIRAACEGAGEWPVAVIDYFRY